MLEQAHFPLPSEGRARVRDGFCAPESFHAPLDFIAPLLQHANTPFFEEDEEDAGRRETARYSVTRS